MKNRNLIEEAIAHAEAMVAENKRRGHPEQRFTLMIGFRDGHDLEFEAHRDPFSTQSGHVLKYRNSPDEAFVNLANVNLIRVNWENVR